MTFIGLSPASQTNPPPSIFDRFDFTFFDGGAQFDSPDAHPTHRWISNRFLENPFDDRGISLAEQLSFSSDHLARMIATNPPAR